MNGRLITIEGIEGVGKTTNLNFIANWLQERGINVVLTREPGGTAVAEAIRKVLLNPDNELTSECELLLMFAARSAHLDELIRPALARGDWVVCDRFTDASYAYQGGGRGLSMDAIDKLKDIVQQGLVPDLTLLLDVPMEVSEQRREARGATDRFETEQISFFRRVQTTYHEIAAAEPDRVKLIDAALPLPEVQAKIAQVLQIFITSEQ